MSKKVHIDRHALAKKKYAIRPQNIVSNFTVDYGVDLEILTDLINGRYDKDTFPACVSSCRETGTKNSIFASGQVISAGAKGYYEALYAAYLLIDRMRRDFGIGFQLYNYGIKNIVTSTHLGFPIDLELFKAVKEVNVLSNDKELGFEKELFAGLRYLLPYTNEDGTQALIRTIVFERGTVVVTGLKNLQPLAPIERALRMFKAFELGRDFRRVPEAARDDYYNTSDWRRWGLVSDPDRQAKVTQTLKTKAKLQKKRQKRIREQDEMYLKIHNKKKQKQEEDDIFKEVKQYKKMLQTQGIC